MFKKNKTSSEMSRKQITSYIGIVYILWSARVHSWDKFNQSWEKTGPSLNDMYLTPYFMLKGWWISSKTLYKYFIRCLVSSHNTLYSLFERAHCVTRLNNSCERDHTYCRSSNREKIKIIHLQLVAPKIEFHPILLQKANWNSVVSPIEPNQRYIAILNKWRDTEQEKRIIFQRGLLDWLLPIWTLPSVWKYVLKCRLFTRN